jgi:hypothetical protein
MTHVTSCNALSIRGARGSLAARGRRAILLVLAVLASIGASLTPACTGSGGAASEERAPAPRPSDDVRQDATRREEPATSAERVEGAPASEGAASPTVARRRREAREDGVQAAGAWIEDLARQ